MKILLNPISKTSRSTPSEELWHLIASMVLFVIFLVCIDTGYAYADHDKHASMRERQACAEQNDLSEQLLCQNALNRRDYLIGSENGRKKFDQDKLGNDDSVNRLVLATGRISGETAFYLGKYAGEHIAVTNRHVVKGKNPRINCSGCEIYFESLLPVDAVSCVEVIAEWPELDLALLALKIKSSKYATKIEEHALQFDFVSSINYGQTLLTAGYGGFGNKGHSQLMINQDQDCRVLSNDNTFIRRQSESSDAVWSFAIGCDASPGDSGSAVLDRKSGKVIGVLWGGHTGKPDWVRDSATLASMLNKGKADAVWRFLNYATPAVKIREIIIRDLNDQKFDLRTATILRAWLEKQGSKEIN